MATIIRVNIAGYGERPASVFGAYDPVTGVLAIAREGAMESDERPGMLRVTNGQTDEWADATFTEEHMREAIQAYFDLQSRRLIIITPKAARVTPDSRIERDGMDDRGTKYRINPDITCGQVAVLVAAWFANIQRSAGKVSDAMEEFRFMTI